MMHASMELCARDQLACGTRYATTSWMATIAGTYTTSDRRSTPSMKADRQVAEHVRSRLAIQGTKMAIDGLTASDQMYTAIAETTKVISSRLNHGDSVESTADVVVSRAFTNGPS